MIAPALRLVVRPTATFRRSLATAAAAGSHSSGTTSTSTSSASSRDASIIPLSNVEAQWEKLSKEEQLTVHAQLEQLQKRDWKSLSIDEKKAAYYVAFGPHGPRTPLDPPGQTLKIFLATAGLVGISGIIFAAVRSTAPPAPRTMTKEWEEATNEKLINQKANPITGISSEGYKGAGMVQSSK